MGEHEEMEVETPLNGAGEGSAPAIIRESGRQMGTLAALRAAIRLFQIWRLEERLHSLRRSVDQHGSQHTAPLVSAQAESSQGAQTAEPWLFGASPASGARRPRWWSWTLAIAVVGVGTVVAMRAYTAWRVTGPEDLPAALQQATAQRERLETLATQLATRAAQLTAQAAKVETVGQRLEAAIHEVDAHAVQLTSQADSAATQTKRLTALEQKLTAQNTQIATHEKQLAAQATQLATLRSHVTMAATPTPVAPTDAGPPTLETFPAPEARLPAATEAGAALGATSLRTMISLPPGLGAAALRSQPIGQHGGKP